MLTVGKWFQSLGDNECIQFWQSSEPILQGPHNLMCSKMVFHNKVEIGEFRFLQDENLKKNRQC